MKDKLFNELCTMTKDKLKNYLIKRFGMQNGDGYCFKQGTFPVLLTAHMDTVHKKQVRKVEYSTDKNGNTIATSVYGIGGDDRCGIYMAIKILEKVGCSVLFCEDEEIGSVGAKKFIKTDLCKSLKGKFKYIIELDRANAYDAVFYEDDNKEFHDFVTKEFFKEAYGTWSDICTLSPALEISSVNVSCGYYNQHTTKEYVVMQEMYRSIQEVIKLLQRTDVTKEAFEFIKCKYTYSGLYDYSSYWDDSDYYKYLIKKYKQEEPQINIEKSDKTSKAFVCLAVTIITINGEEEILSYGEDEIEAWYNFFMDNPSICYGDVYDYYFY